MSDFYTLNGLPSDLLTSDVIGGRKLKVDAQVSVPPVEVDLPDTYPLPADQVTALKVVESAQLGAWSVSIDNFPAVQEVIVEALPLPAGAATEAKQLPDNHQVTVSNQPSEYPLPAAQAEALAPQTDALTDSELRAAPVQVTDSGDGVYSYLTGVSGVVSVTGRVLRISAVSVEVDGSLEVNSLGPVPIPATTSFELSPAGNLVDPTVTFTDTTAYVIEVVT